MNLVEIYILSQIFLEFKMVVNEIEEHPEFAIMKFTPGSSYQRTLTTDNIKNYFGVDEMTFRMLLASQNIGYYVQNKRMVDHNENAFIFSTDSIGTAASMLASLTIAFRTTEGGDS